MFLTSDELQELTDRKNPSHQSRWLAERGYAFEISAAGKPKVLRSEVESRLSSQSQARAKTQQPNWEALRTA